MRSLFVLFTGLSLVAACDDDPSSSPDAGLPDPVDAAAVTPDGRPAAVVEVRHDGAIIESVGFGALALGSDAVVTVTVHNVSSSAVTVGAAVVGTAPAFTIDGAATSCDDGPVAPAATCAIALHFVPTTLGAQAGSLRLTVDGAPTAAVALDGTGVAALDLAFTPASRDFGLVEIGGTDEQVVTIRNDGSEPVGIDRVVIAGATFTLVGTDCGDHLDAGASCAATVRFAPTVLGGLAASLLVVTESGAASAAFRGAGAFRVTVGTTGAGTGAVRSEPAGIACGDTCTGLFSGPVQLVAEPAAGSRFVSWAAPCARASCTIEARTTPVSTTARIEPIGVLRSVTVIAAGAPLGEIALSTPTRNPLLCDDTCAYALPVGEEITISAAAPGGYALSGPCAGQETCTFTVDDDTTITATFGTSRGGVWIARPDFEATAAAYTPDGDLVVAGATTLARYSRAGVLRWSITMPILPSSQLVGLAADAGAIYVVRAAQATGTPVAISLEKLDGLGVWQWSRPITTTESAVVARADVIDVAPSGDVAVGFGRLTTVLTPAGVVRWTANRGDGGIGYGPDGTLYRVEWMTTRVPCCSEILRFDATGAATALTETVDHYGESDLDVGADGAVVVQIARYHGDYQGALIRLGGFRVGVGIHRDSTPGRIAAMTGGRTVSLDAATLAPITPVEVEVYDSSGTSTFRVIKQQLRADAVAADGAGRFAVVGFYQSQLAARRGTVIEVFQP